MKKKDFDIKRRVVSLVAMLTLVVVAACDNASYTAGDGDLSFLKAEFADLRVVNGTAVSAQTDKGENLTLSKGIAVGNVNAPDTVVRCLIYYNKVDGSDVIELKKAEAVMVLRLYDLREDEEIKTDAVTMTSMWLSDNGKYINMQIGIKTGNDTSESAMQRVGIVKMEESDYGKGKVTLSLFHDQAGQPEYYTKELKISIPAMSQDTMVLNVNTYSGQMQRVFVVR